jgi:hypothetical protein
LWACQPIFCCQQVLITAALLVLVKVLLELLVMVLTVMVLV